MKNWRDILRENFTKLDALADFLELGPDERSCLLDRPKFILNLPRRLAAKMAKGTLDDPLLRQFVPLKEELQLQPDYTLDPVQDTTFQLEGKLLQKYPQRSLILSTSACAMHCRYCFRQNFPYETAEKSFDKELRQIRENPDLREVILSGGDPLSLSNERLGELIDELNKIEFLERIRFHTRFPIGIPERLDEGFVELLGRSKKQIWFVLHCNHPRELDDEVIEGLKKIQRLGIPVLNQAVLLREVNDSFETLKALAEKLSNNGVMFYYLHQLDRVQGAAHFEVAPEEGLKLVEELREALSGYAVPLFVQEVPRKLSKTPVLHLFNGSKP